MASFSFLGRVFVILALLCTSIAGHAVPLDFGSLDKRQSTNLVGYFGIFFKGNDQRVYFYLSNGNDPCSFRPLNGDRPVLSANGGTGGVRDMSIVVGDGNEKGRKWFMLGTDLDITKTDFNRATRTGSLSMFIWESSDLVNWGGERLIKVEEDIGGMLWAPEGIWSSSKGKYFVFWSAKLYPKNDPNHQANGIKSVIRGSYTSDFNNFDPPFTYLDANPMSVIDMSILHLGGNTYVRFIKNEADNSVFSEISTGGLDGQWSRKGVIEKEVEGPAPYLDNQVKGKGHLLLDFFGRGGYWAYESDDIPSGQWRKSCSGFPGGLRHGFVVPVDQRQYDGLSQRYR
ncbi:arabinosidase [Phyllosticta capitalensis]